MRHFLERPVATRRVQTRLFTTSRDKTRQDATAHDKTRQPSNDNPDNTTSQTEDLKDKLLEAEIRAAGHKAVAEQMRRDRDQAFEQIRKTDRGVGILQDRILKLGGDATFPEFPDALPPSSETHQESNERTSSTDSVVN